MDFYNRTIWVNVIGLLSGLRLIIQDGLDDLLVGLVVNVLFCWAVCWRDVLCMSTRYELCDYLGILFGLELVIIWV